MYTPPRGKCVDVDTREKVTSLDVDNVNTCEVRRNTTNNAMGPKVQAQPDTMKDVLKSNSDKDHPIKAQ
jgi:hypothetical protein